MGWEGAREPSGCEMEQGWWWNGHPVLLLPPPSDGSQQSRSSAAAAPESMAVYVPSPPPPRSPLHFWSPLLLPPLGQRRWGERSEHNAGLARLLPCFCFFIFAYVICCPSGAAFPPSFYHRHPGLWFPRFFALRGVRALLFLFSASSRFRAPAAWTTSGRRVRIPPAASASALLPSLSASSIFLFFLLLFVHLFSLSRPLISLFHSLFRSRGGYISSLGVWDALFVLDGLSLSSRGVVGTGCVSGEEADGA